MPSPLMTPEESFEIFETAARPWGASTQLAVHAAAKAQYDRAIAAIKAIPVETLAKAIADSNGGLGFLSDAHAVRAAIVAALSGEG